MTSDSNMKSKYKSGKSVAKNQTVPIGVDDPRLSWNKIAQTKARQGAELDIIGIEGKSLIVGGSTLITPNPNSTKDQNSIIPSIIIPPMDGLPPKTYPGGSGPSIVVPTNPTDVSASWSGEDLVVTLNWDYANPLNATVNQFILELTADGITRRTPLNTFLVNKTQTAQTLTLTKSLNRTTFGLFRTKITSICVLAADPLNNISQTVCAQSVPTYVLDLPVPTITLAAISNGYSIGYTTPTQSSYDALDVWEIEDPGTVAPAIVYGSDGVTPSNYRRSYFDNLNPANIITQNYNKRWVVARFSSSGGTFTSFCAAQAVTPTSPVSVDNTPPDEVTQIIASWSGDNIVVAYKLPAQNAGSRIQIELTAPNNLVGYFYRFPDGSGRNQTTTITKKDLFDQFGAHYSSFTGILRSIDAVDNRTPGISFNVPLRTNPLSGITPTFTLTPLTNGYSVFATNYATTVGVSYMEVYAKHTPWVGDPIDDTYVVYSGANPAVVIDTDYSTVYVKIHYYDDFGNVSLYSLEDTVVPLGPGEITSFETPITFGSNGVIYAGGDYASGKRTLFKSSGIFAYDASSTNGSTGLTTQIISDASAGTPTFITTRAQIADWNVTDTKIENDLSGAPTKYTGLSATGTYSFWAGSDVSGGNSSAKFTVTPGGAVTARELYIVGTGDANSNLISAGGLFTVKHDGTFTATGANITGTVYATGGEFTGNVKLNGGSLYALGSGGTISSGIRTIFNSSGIAAYNASGGYAQMLTTPLQDGSVFATTAANIGGWKVDSSKIEKTSIYGKGNITLDSSNGYITVSNSSITTSLAGINSPGNNINDVVFWAGGTNPNSIDNPFRITLGGKLYSTSADITGTISSVGSLGTMTMDGSYGYMSLKTAGESAPTSYLIPRNDNIYLTAPSTTEPWENSTTKTIATSGPTSAPYFSAGSKFKDYWNSEVSGIGIYTGDWDYFTKASTSPFITASTTGIQLSVNANLGLILDGGTAATGTKLEPAIPSGTPSMLFYTSKQKSTDGKPNSPSTAYGAWAAFTNSKINLVAKNNLLIAIDGTENASKIELISNTSRSRVVSKLTEYVGDATVNDGFDSAYRAASQIVLKETEGVRISGSPFIGDMNVNTTSYTGTKGTFTGLSADYMKYYDLFYPLGQSNPARGRGYLNIPGLGPLPRSRAIVEDPTTGEMKLGFAIYYQDTSIDDQTPSGTSGYVGDLWVQY